MSYVVPNVGGPAGNFVLLDDDEFAFSIDDAIYLAPFAALQPIS